jgi:hypothetical protein
MFSVKADPLVTNTEYWYQYDNQGYMNHMVQQSASYKSYEVLYQHNETESQTAFYYDMAVLSKNFVWHDAKIKLGAGALYGLNWSPVPVYNIDIFYKNFNLNASRNPVAATNNNQSNTQTGYSKNYSDIMTLTYDFNLTDKYTIVVGGLLSLYDDSNIKKGVILRNIYNINDTFSVQTNSRLTYNDLNGQAYFSPDIYEYHRFLGVVSYPITPDLVLKASAGPSLINIQQRREIVPFYDVKIVYNNEHIGKWNLGYTCDQTTFEYKFCQAGASVQLTF